jgi:hypothetical protein
MIVNIIIVLFFQIYKRREQVKIETKFNVGDNIYALRPDKIIETKVKNILVRVTRDTNIIGTPNICYESEKRILKTG